MYFLLTIILAILTAIMQVAFLSHLGAPLADLCLPVVAVVVAVAFSRPLSAALWAVFSGLVLDLHGIFGFGAELAALFAVFGAAQFLFSRFLPDAGVVSVFLLAGAAAFARYAVLAVIDGVRVMFGGGSYLFAGGAEALMPVIASILVSAAAAALIAALIAGIRRRLEQAFIAAPRRLR